MRSVEACDGVNQMLLCDGMYQEWTERYGRATRCRGVRGLNCSSPPHWSLKLGCWGVLD